MFSAHGATVSVSRVAVTVNYSPLAASLAGRPEKVIELAGIAGTRVVAPTEWLDGYVEFLRPDGVVVDSVCFSAQQAAQAEAFAEAVSQALRGQAPEDAPGQGHLLPGMDFVAFAADLPTPAVSSLRGLAAVKFVAGKEVAAKVWQLQRLEAAGDPTEVSFAQAMQEFLAFVGSTPLVAHNAQRYAMALQETAYQADFNFPALRFGCTLAIARSYPTRFATHDLPTVAAMLGVAAGDPDESTGDLLANTRLSGLVAAALAAQTQPADSFVDFFHSSGFTLGEFSSQAVFPVLHDRENTAVTAQKQAYSEGEAESGQAILQALRPDYEAKRAWGSGAGTDARSPRGATGSGGAGGAAGSAGRSAAQKTPRRSAWSAVATPDVIPEPNLEADPNGPLYGKLVVLTGDFEPWDKGHLWKLMAAQGATPAKNVTLKTTLLVAGPWKSMTSKEKKAREYQERGKPIEIWTAEQLYDVLGLNDQPPF